MDWQLAIIGLISPAIKINFAEQFDDSNGCLAGVVFAGLDLTWLSDHLKGNGLPATSSKLIADREGNIIARLPHPEEFIGKNMRGSHEAIMDGGEAGWEEVTGVDGVTRIFGYVPSSLPPRDFFLSIGEAKAEAFAAVNSATWRDGALILAGLVGSICIAWAGRILFRYRRLALRRQLLGRPKALLYGPRWRPGRAFAGRRDSSAPAMRPWRIAAEMRGG
jgi:hypothetical protein